MSVIADLIRAGVDPELIERVIEWGRPVDGRSKHAQAQARYIAKKKIINDHADQQKGPNGSPNDNTLTPSLPPKTKPTLRSGLERARARRTQIDAGAIPFDFEFARQQGFEKWRITREFEQFCDHHRKLGSRMADWQAAWRTWVRNAIKFQARAGPAGRSNGVRGFLENVAQLMAPDGTDSRTQSRNGSSHQAVLGFPEHRG